ncbi:unnamed protein product [Closterium sp. NIES-65]|nr:unnamed protein product [Closterium sp. NIES-65]
MEVPPSVEITDGQRLETEQLQDESSMDGVQQTGEQQIGEQQTGEERIEEQQMVDQQLGEQQTGEPQTGEQEMWGIRDGGRVLVSGTTTAPVRRSTRITRGVPPVEASGGRRHHGDPSASSSGGGGAARTTGVGSDGAELIAEWQRRSAEAGAHFFPLQRAEDAPSRDEIHRRILAPSVSASKNLEGRILCLNICSVIVNGHSLFPFDLPPLCPCTPFCSSSRQPLSSTLRRMPPPTSVYPYYVNLKLGSRKQEFSMALNLFLPHTFVPCDCLQCGSMRKGTTYSKPFNTLSSTTLKYISCTDQSCQGGVEFGFYGCNAEEFPNYLNITGLLPGDDALCVYDAQSGSYDYYEGDYKANNGTGPYLESVGHVMQDTVYLTAPDGTEVNRSITLGCGVNQQGYWGMQGWQYGSWAAGGVLGLGWSSTFLWQLTGANSTRTLAVCLEATPTNETGWDGELPLQTGSSHLTIGATGLPAGASYATIYATFYSPSCSTPSLALFLSLPAPAMPPSNLPPPAPRPPFLSFSPCRHQLCHLLISLLLLHAPPRSLSLPASASYLRMDFWTGLQYSHITLTTPKRALNITDDPAYVNPTVTTYVPANFPENATPGFLFMPESFVHLLRYPLFMSLLDGLQAMTGNIFSAAATSTYYQLPCFKNKNKSVDPFTTFPTIDIAFLNLSDTSATSHFYLKPHEYLAQSVTGPCKEPGLFNKYLSLDYDNGIAGWMDAPHCRAEPLLPPPSPPPPPSPVSSGATHSLSPLPAALSAAIVLATFVALLALSLL